MSSSSTVVPVLSSSNEASPSSLTSSALDMPPAAITHDYRSSTPELIDPFDEFFGYSLSMSSTGESRHDRRLSFDSNSDLDSDMAPPPYAEPPAYEIRQSEPLTLAKYLFRFGFLFPPFWIMGAFILISPLQAPDALSSSSSSSSPSPPFTWLPEKTPAERKTIITHLRKIEIKWAWRCLYAILSLVSLAVAAGVITWVLLRA